MSENDRTASGPTHAGEYDGFENLEPEIQALVVDWVRAEQELGKHPGSRPYLRAAQAARLAVQHAFPGYDCYDIDWPFMSVFEKRLLKDGKRAHKRAEQALPA